MQAKEVEDVDLQIAELVISDKGYKRFLDWEKLFVKYPLAGVMPQIAASRMVWGEMEAVVNSKTKYAAVNT